MRDDVLERIGHLLPEIAMAIWPVSNDTSQCWIPDSRYQIHSPGAIRRIVVVCPNSKIRDKGQEESDWDEACQDAHHVFRKRVANVQHEEPPKSTAYRFRFLPILWLLALVRVGATCQGTTRRSVVFEM